MGMNSITVPVNNSSEAFSLVVELKDLGLYANKDFTWSYHPTRTDYFDYYNNEVIGGPSVTFTFVNESLLSYFKLKWG